jgi:toxin ParE1/3/4
MSLVVLRPIAQADLAQIWEFIADDSELQADAFIHRFDAQFQLLASCPGLGRLRDELLPGLRSSPFEKYVIFYRSIEGGVEIARVLQSARDIDAQFCTGT